MINRYSVEELEKLLIQLKEIISVYLKYTERGLKIPFGLKGNYGEILVYKNLLEKFPSKTRIDFIGGQRRGYDIDFDGKKIQVKTNLKKDAEERRNWFFNAENCPSIKKKHFHENRFDYIILVILYLNAKKTEVIKEHIYIFNERDFKYFSSIGSFRPKDEKTIVNVLRIEGQLPKTKLRIKEKYHTLTYNTLFQSSKENWSKLI